MTSRPPDGKHGQEPALIAADGPGGDVGTQPGPVDFEAIGGEFIGNHRRWRLRAHRGRHVPGPVERFEASPAASWRRSVATRAATTESGSSPLALARAADWRDTGPVVRHSPRVCGGFVSRSAGAGARIAAFQGP